MSEQDKSSTPPRGDKPDGTNDSENSGKPFHEWNLCLRAREEEVDVVLGKISRMAMNKHRDVVPPPLVVTSQLER